MIVQRGMKEMRQQTKLIVNETAECVIIVDYDTKDEAELRSSQRGTLEWRIVLSDLPKKRHVYSR